MLMGRCGVCAFPAVVVLLLLLVLCMKVLDVRGCGLKASCPFDKSPKHIKTV